MSTKSNKKVLGKSSEKASPTTFEPSQEYKATVAAQSYIGKKGYSIPKSALDPADLEFLYKDLYMIPEKGGAQFLGAGAGDTDAFPVYRENSKKIYLPRFYGIDRYGRPSRDEIVAAVPSSVETINVPFVKTLRDYQIEVIDKYLAEVEHGKCNETRGGILQLGCGLGKCVAKDTKILMYDGTIKLVQDVVVGDQIMGDDSKPRNVLSLARGRETMYKVHETKGNGYTVNASHILSLKYGTFKNKKTPKGTVVDISVKDYLDLPKSYHGRAGPLYGYRVPITFPEKEVVLDPYLLGYWLGDGHSSCSSITTQESTVIKYIVDCFKTKHTSLYLKYAGGYEYRINSIGKRNMMMGFLRENNLLLNKHIPHDYKCNSRKIQLELLAGLIDSDGYYYNNCYEIVQKNEKLAEDIEFLARSLGFAAFKKKVNKTCTNAPGGPKTGVYHIIKIYGSGLEEIPTLCPRKKGSVRKQIKDALNYRIRLEKLKKDDYYGFEIDGNRRFVLGDFTVTHNTVMSINILSQIGKKTLIIVHKEFLLNQWIERITEFCPSATIGKIQGPVFDIEGKDIVIGMLQTVYDREFPEGAFDSFGLTIVDEVHRIGSCQFSKALLRVQTPIMLGVTATLDRKDGLTRVIHHFMGPLIYNQASQAPINRSDFEHVLVRGMEFISTDQQFQEVATDFRGNVMFSTMITKLCSFGPRTNFIIRILRDLISENPDAQILVLGHNRSLLVELHEAVVYQEIATVGYYLGGMKQQDLDRTTERQIILATYAMASEGFDHKNLSILVMITPKTDIVQSVGRIFRTKHERPLIVDVIDQHDIFKNQWRKRLTYYRKSGYRIETIQSPEYHGFQNPATKWTQVRRCGGGGAAATTHKNKLAPTSLDQEAVAGKCFIQIDPADLAASDDH
jgi:superfamily II DNA or RNA helicase